MECLAQNKAGMGWTWSRRNDGGETLSEPTPRPHRRLALASQIVCFAPLAILFVGFVWAFNDNSPGTPLAWAVLTLSLILVPVALLGLGSRIGVAIGRSRLEKGKKFWPAYLITFLGFFVLPLAIPIVLLLLGNAFDIWL